MTQRRLTRRDFVRGTAAIGAGAAAVPWLAAPPGAAAPVRGGRLVVGVQADIPHLDPHRSALTISYVSLSPMYQALTELGPNLELRPQLATSWTVSPDGLTWTFALRPGVQFHNGRALTSRDVRFSIERILDPKTGARGRGDLSSITSIGTPHPNTVVFRLKAPFGFFPNKLATAYQAIIPREAVDSANNVTKAIGTGPFQFGEWVTNDHLTMRRFDRYWESGKPYVDEVTVKPIPDETVRLTALQTGDLSIALDVPQARLRALFAQPSRDYIIRLVRGGAGQGVIVLNTRHKPFDNVKVRQAVAYAMNKREMVDVLYRGWGVTDNQNFSPSSPWYLPVKDRPVDLAKAKSLLAEAGMPNGFRTTMTVGNGYGLPDLAQIFQSQMRRLGVDVNIQVFDIPTWAGRINSGNFDIDNTGFFAKVDPDDGYYRYAHSNGGVWQLSGYLNDPGLDRLLDEGRTEADVAKARATYTRVVEILQDSASMLIFGSGHSAAGWRSNVQGFAPQLIGALSYAGGGVQEAWLAK
ncbi:MAG TPA: ABC transporter substrate-binding protein [bacterium]|nr:ABC transporter substrate-binding protein [bacterium]